MKKTDLKLSDYCTVPTIASEWEDGEEMYKDLKKAIDNGEMVEIDFSNIEMIISHFVCSAFGPFFENMSVSEFKSKVVFTNIDEHELDYMDLVYESFVQYYEREKNKREDGKRMI